MGRDQKIIEDAAAYPEDPFWLSDEVAELKSWIRFSRGDGADGTGVTMQGRGAERDVLCRVINGTGAGSGNQCGVAPEAPDAAGCNSSATVEMA